MAEAYEDLYTMPVGALGIIAMPGSEALAEQVDCYITNWRRDLHSIPQSLSGGYMRDTYQIPVNCPRFGTGEGKAMIPDSVRGLDIFIVADLFNHGLTYDFYGQKARMTPDEHFQDLKRIIGAIGGKARRITVIMTMLYEGRQHKRATRESLDCAIMLQELVNMGVENIITFDAHDPRVQNAIPLSGFENVHPTYQMIKALVNTVPDVKIDSDHLMVISPDEGAMNRCIYYTSVMGVDLGMFYKRRDYSRVVNGRNPIVAHVFLGDNVEGKDVIVVDDMISSGESMIDVVRQLKERKARRIFVFSTFGLFNEGYEKFDKAYQDGLFDKIFTTNLIYREPALLERPWYQEVNMSKYIAHIVNVLNHDMSISSLLSPVQRIHQLMERHEQDLQAKEN
ncbi:MAG: ribose-phosphate pyrophosphokinase [Ruminococcaceae bacterium]|nr:ribose-phosphate pyrophosphokinase [Oscillospiraceae bacterium]